MPFVFFLPPLDISSTAFLQIFWNKSVVCGGNVQENSENSHMYIQC
jgi:hypothetical protein